MRVALSHKTGVNVDHIDAYVLGEHGDTSFENFDEAIIDHKPLRSYKELDEQTLVDLETDVRKRVERLLLIKVQLSTVLQCA